MLVGLSLGAFYQLGPHLAVLIVLGALLAVIASAALADMFWRHERLPVLVIPFLLVAAITALVARQLSDLSPFIGYSEFTRWLPYWARIPQSAGGYLFHHPPCRRCRRTGCYRLAFPLPRPAGCRGHIGRSGHVPPAGGTPPAAAYFLGGFNMVLTAIAIGGIYTVPGR